MGLSLSSLVNTVFGGAGGVVDLAGSVLGIENPRTTAITTGISALFGPAAGAAAGALGATFTGEDEGTIWNDEGEVVSGGGGNGGVIPTMGAVPVIGAALARAIGKLASVFGITAAGARQPLAYASRIWASLSGWAAKNPGISLVSLLVSLGLTAEEAAHFLAWGATKKKRRRRRGITAAQLRTTKRTMRTIVRMYHSLPHSSAPRRVFGGSRTSIVKA